MANSTVVLPVAENRGEPRGIADSLADGHYAELAAQIDEDRVHTIEVAFADTVGVLRGKQVPVPHFLRGGVSGIPFCTAVLAWDVQCEIFPGVAFAGFENGYPDLFARPDLTTYSPLPWRPGSALVFADLYDEHGRLLDVAPRQVLQRVLAHARELGYKVKVGAELEFYLLDADRRPVYDGIQCYSLDHVTRLEPVLEQIRLGLESLGIGVEASGTEYGPAQIEINLAYKDALAMADATLLFKKAVKEIAREHGLLATFMAKPWAGESGSSFHVHQSLWSLDGQTNLFAADHDLAGAYLAGLLANTRELAALGAPNVNSYKRFRAESFAPTGVGWGTDNRTVSSRALLSKTDGSRLEHRAGSADANPYLIIAANVAAGLHGVTNDLSLPVEVSGNGYSVPSLMLPGTLGEALDLLEASKLAREALGKDFLQLFLAIGRHDAAAHQATVTDWERDRYLEMV